MYLNLTTCCPAGTSTPTRLGAIIAGFAGSPSTVTVQRGSYVALSSTTAGRSRVDGRVEDAVLQRVALRETFPPRPAGGCAPVNVCGGGVAPANATLG